jgi:hypothetical protein
VSLSRTVAISNYRLVDIDRDQGTVSFTYHDNQAKGEKKVLTLSGVEFIHRFLWHVLPKGYVRIRHFGLHNSYARAARLSQARALLGLEPTVPEAEPLSLRGWLIEVVGIEEIDRCPHCGRTSSAVPRRNPAQPTLARWASTSVLASRDHVKRTIA